MFEPRDGSFPKSQCCPGLWGRCAPVPFSADVGLTGNPSARISCEVAGLQPYISDRYRPTLTWNQSLVACSLLLANRLPAAAP